MKRDARKLLMGVALGVIGLFVLFVINQTAQFVNLVDRLHPALGTAVLWVLVALYATLVVTTFIAYVRLPKPLIPPSNEGSPAFDEHMERLKKRLQTNDHVAHLPMNTREDVEAALGVLGAKADKVTRETALQVFLTTSLSQNGSLDAVAVVGAQWRMVNRIAKVYGQRPTLRDMLYLYGNVAASALLARQIEDMDFAEYVQPVVSAVTSSVVGVVPGMQAATTVMIHSMLTGSANAFMTLRVGVVTKIYAGSLSLPPRNHVRRSAFVQAAQMIPGIINDGAKKTTDMLVSAALGTAKGATKAVVKGTATATKKVMQTTVGVAEAAGHTAVNTAKSAGRLAGSAVGPPVKKAVETVKGVGETAVDAVEKARQRAADTVKAITQRERPSPARNDDPIDERTS